MIGLDWLRRQAGRAVGDGGALGRPSDADVQRVPPLVEAALERHDEAAAALRALAGTGTTTAEAMAAVAEGISAIRAALAYQADPDQIVACGCWPRYVGGCRCATRLKTAA